MSWWISVQLLAARFSHHSKPPPRPAPPHAGACAKLFISSPYDATCLSTFLPDGVFLVFGWGPSGLPLRHADGLSTRCVQPEARRIASLPSLPPARPVLHTSGMPTAVGSHPPHPHELDTFSQPYDQFCPACGFFPARQLDGTVLSCVRYITHHRVDVLVPCARCLRNMCIFWDVEGQHFAFSIPWLCFATGKKLQDLQRILQPRIRRLFRAAWRLQFPPRFLGGKSMACCCPPSSVLRMPIARPLNLVLFMCCLPNLAVRVISYKSVSVPGCI